MTDRRIVTWVTGAAVVAVLSHAPPVLANAPAGPAKHRVHSRKTSKSAPAQTATKNPATQRRRFGVPTWDPRRFTVGAEGVITYMSRLDTHIVRLTDKVRTKAVALAGAGLFLRWRPKGFVALEATVRSASARYLGAGDEGTIKHDQITADVGVLWYVVSGDVMRVAVDGGVGGSFGRVGYDLAARDGVQRFGSAVLRVGVDGEFALGPVAFVLSLRSYGVITPSHGASNSGALFDGVSGGLATAPVHELQTWLVGTAGLGYRF